MDHNNFGQGGDTGDNRKLAYARKAAQESGEILATCSQYRRTGAQSHREKHPDRGFQPDELAA